MHYFVWNLSYIICSLFSIRVTEVLTIGRTMCENVDRSIASVKTRWYQLQSDVKCVRSSLEDAAEYWHQYVTSSNVFFDWLPQAEQVLCDQADGWQVGSSFMHLFYSFIQFRWEPHKDLKQYHVTA